MFRKRRDGSYHAICHAGLPQITIPCAQPDYRVRIKSGYSDELVEHVVLSLAVENLADRVLEHRRARHNSCDLATAQGQTEVMDVIAIA